MIEQMVGTLNWNALYPGSKVIGDPPTPEIRERSTRDYVEQTRLMVTNRSVSVVRIFIVIVATCILTLAAFGLGAAVGLRWSNSSETMRWSGSAAPEPQVAPAATPASPVILASPSPAAEAQDENGGSLDVQLFGEAWELLEEQFFGELPDGKQITYNAIRGVVDRLGDPHTAFVDPKEAALLQADIDGHFEGIGARVDLAEQGGVEIMYLFAGQPAEKAGLQVGDVVLAVNGEDVTRLGLTEAITLIRGPRDSTALLKVKRGEQSPIEIAVVRDRIEIPVVQSKWLADGRIAHITLSEFSSVAPERLAEAIKDAVEKKPVGLILDLRGNPGGLLDSAVSIGSFFVKEGPIVFERMKDGSERVYERRGRYLLGDLRLAVLVDGGSASASEIVAGAIQDAGSGMLVGEKTFGKGSVQLPNALSDGSQLRITVAHWFTPKMRAIDGDGLEPDLSVSLSSEDIAAQRDPQLDRAMQYLLQGK
jgi:carboxyl-terminal processing protease